MAGKNSGQQINFFNKVKESEKINDSLLSDFMNEHFESQLKHDKPLRLILECVQGSLVDFKDKLQNSLYIRAEVGERMVIFKTRKEPADKFKFVINDDDLTRVTVTHLERGSKFKFDGPQDVTHMTETHHGCKEGFFNKVVEADIIDETLICDFIGKYSECQLNEDEALRKLLLRVQKIPFDDWMRKSILIKAEVGERVVIFKTTRTPEDKFKFTIDGDMKIAMEHFEESDKSKNTKASCPDVDRIRDIFNASDAEFFHKVEIAEKLTEEVLSKFINDNFESQLEDDEPFRKLLQRTQKVLMEFDETLRSNVLIRAEVENKVVIFQTEKGPDDWFRFTIDCQGKVQMAHIRQSANFKIRNYWWPKLGGIIGGAVYVTAEFLLGEATSEVLPLAITSSVDKG